MDPIRARLAPSGRGGCDERAPHARARRALDRARRHRRRLGRRRPGAALGHVRTAGADPGVRGVRAHARRRPGWCTARPTPASARRAARSARCSRSPPRTRSTARTAATTSSWPRPWRTWRRRGSTSSRACPRTSARCVLRTLAEICGLARGYGNGRGGSMHLQWKDAGAMGTNAIVGGGVPQAAGYAWSARQAGTAAVSVTYLGDGAANIGSTLESFNLAAAWRLPVCFFVENNQYAVSTTVAEATGEPRLSARGPGFGIASWRVDGMDPLAVHLAMREAVEHMRAGNGPTLVEADTYRFFHQNGPFPGSAFRYRSKEEEAELAGPRPGRADRRPAGPARAAHPGAGRAVGRRGRAPDDRGRRRAAGAAARREAGPAADPAGRVARPVLRGRRRARRPVRVRRRPLRRRLGRDDRDAVHRRRRRGDEPADGRRTRGSSSWARTCTGSTAAPTAPPAGSRRRTRTGCSAPRSARTRSPAWPAGSPWTAGSARSSS